jgi:hypothetical protein
MGRDWFIRRAAGRLGKRLAKKGTKDAGKRVAGWLRHSPKEWADRFRYYRKHFSERAAKADRAHGVFDKRYRDSDSLKQLVEDAASNPSRSPVYSAKGHSPERVIIERDFGKRIGYETHSKKPCSILRIAADIKGRVISVFPAAEFEGAGKSMLLAAVVFQAIEGVYAEEARAADEFYHPCQTGLLDFLWHPLLEPTCGGTPVKPDQQLVNRRAAEAVNRVERDLGFALSSEERADVRDEVTTIWYPRFVPNGTDDEE